MTRAREMEFTFVRFPGNRATLRRNGDPWPRHVVINEDWLNWADESAWVLRQMNGDVAIAPSDGELAVYRPVHESLGDRHYDLVRVGNRPIIVA